MPAEGDVFILVDKEHPTVLLLTFEALNGLRPLYLRLHLSLNAPQRALCPTGTNFLVVPGSKTVQLVLNQPGGTHVLMTELTELRRSTWHIAEDT